MDAGAQRDVRGRGEQARPDRAGFEAAPRELLSRNSALKPAVWRVEGVHGPYAVKDVSGLRPVFRGLGRFLMRREMRVLRRLEGLSSVPQLLGALDRDAFAFTWVQGLALDRASFQGRGRELANRLFDLLARIHARGVFHLDVRQRQNVLLQPSGEVALVDFGAALAPGRILRLLLGPLLGWVDRQAVLKYLVRYAPEDMTPAEARSLLRGQRVRRLWVVSPHRSRGESQTARRRLEEEPDEEDDRHDGPPPDTADPW